VHTPLVFDIIDRWKEGSIARCTYHARPPDGHAYTTRPVSATDAEDRRQKRFEKSNHHPAKMTVPEEESNPIFPMTLDLRVPAPGQKAPVEKPGLFP
jgi:uncharacterized protein (DUF2126 family)